MKSIMGNLPEINRDIHKRARMWVLFGGELLQVVCLE